VKRVEGQEGKRMGGMIKGGGMGRKIRNRGEKFIGLMHQTEFFNQRAGNVPYVIGAS